jgi:hemolysin activation/secretion protein
VITPGGELSASALLFGRDERLRSVQYRQAVGVEGWMLKAALTSYRGDPDAVLGLDNAFERRNTNLRRELSALYPLRLAAQSALFVSGGVYSVDNVDTTRNPANGAFLSDIARVRAGFAQVEWQQDDGRVGRTGQVMLAHGFDAAGAASAYASNVAGLAGPNPARIDFTRVAAQAREARRFANDWGAAVSAGVQWSPHPLPATERMSFGGSRFARGYPAGETSGDQGWGVGFEVHRSFAVASTRVKQVQPYLLLEAARAYGHLATPAPARLSSVSAGVRVADLAHYAVDVSISRATGDRPLENPERRPRLALQFSWRL